MAKFTEKLALKIIRLTEEDVYTISEICEALNISRKSYYEWKDTKPEFRRALEEAEEKRDEAFATLARTSMKKKLEGYVLVEEKITYVPDKSNPSQLVVKSKTVKKKEYAPDTKTINLVLEREDRRKEKREKEERIASSVTPKKTMEERILELKRRSGFYTYEGEYKYGLSPDICEGEGVTKP